MAYPYGATNAVSFGPFSASSLQQPSSIAIGASAGRKNQGPNSIAIGTLAGQLNQNQSTIVLNATGTALDTASDNAIYMAPMRFVTASNVMTYNSSSKEVSYTDTMSSLTISSLSTRSLGASTLYASTLSSNTMVLNSTLSVSSIGVSTSSPVFPTSLFYSGAYDMTQTPYLNFGLQVHNTTASGFNNRSNMILFTDNNSTQAAIGGYRMEWGTNYLGGLLFMVGSQPTGYTQNTPANTTQAAGSLTEAMRITATGAVGIGTNAPAATLDVRGTIWGNGIYSGINGSVSTYGYISLQAGTTNNTGYIEFRRGGGSRDAYIGYGDTSSFYFNVEQARNLVFNTNGTARMTILSGGFVGIGIDGAPYSETIFRVKTPNASGVSAIFGGTGGKDVYMFTDGTAGWIGANSTLGFYAGNNLSNYMMLATDGNVGIGTASPTVKLYVNGDTTVNGTLRCTGTFIPNYIYVGANLYTSFSLYYYIVTYSPGLIYNSGNTSYAYVSIYTDGVIVSTAWIGTISDQRLKKNVKPVASMLDTIDQIEMVSFDFIDEISNKRNECGIIAQQLETVFPNAIDKMIGVIPCYMVNAISQMEIDGQIHITFVYDPTNNEQAFNVGDKIKLLIGEGAIPSESKGKHTKLVTVRGIIENGFITDKWNDYHTADLVFVYGKEVDDLRNVDQEQLGMLSLKGVQELHQLIKTREQTIQSLTDTLSSTQQQLSSLIKWAKTKGFSA